MRTLALMTALLVSVTTAGAQSLGEAARKEQERREKAREKAKAAKVITDEDLAATKGELANVMSGSGTTTAVSPSPSPARRGRGLRIPGTSDDGDASPPDREAEWRQRAAAARERIERAEAVYAELDRQIRLGQPARTNANGVRVMYSAQQMKMMADAAQEEVAAARQALADLEDEARRANVPPGWLR